MSMRKAVSSSMAFKALSPTRTSTWTSSWPGVAYSRRGLTTLLSPPVLPQRPTSPRARLVSAASVSASVTRSGGFESRRWLDYPEGRRNFTLLKELAKLAPGSGSTAGAADAVSSGDVTRFKDTKVLKYSTKELYTIVSDIDSYRLFLPLCQDSRIVGPAPPPASPPPPPPSSPSTSPSARPGSQTQMAGADASAEPDRRVHAELTIGFKGMREKYTSLVELKEGEWVKATALPHPLFKHLSTLWKFSPAKPNSSNPNASTRVDFTVEYAFASPFHAAIAGGIFRELASKMLVAFEDRAKELYGRR